MCKCVEYSLTTGSLFFRPLSYWQTQFYHPFYSFVAMRELHSVCSSTSCSKYCSAKFVAKVCNTVYVGCCCCTFGVVFRTFISISSRAASRDKSKTIEQLFLPSIFFVLFAIGSVFDIQCHSIRRSGSDSKQIVHCRNICELCSGPYHGKYVWNDSIIVYRVQRWFFPFSLFFFPTMFIVREFPNKILAFVNFFFIH